MVLIKNPFRSSFVKRRWNQVGFGACTVFSKQGILLMLHQREDPVRAALTRPTPPFHISVSGMSHSQTHLHGLPCLTHTGGLQPETHECVCWWSGWPGEASEKNRTFRRHVLSLWKWQHSQSKCWNITVIRHSPVLRLLARRHCDAAPPNIMGCKVSLELKAPRSKWRSVKRGNRTEAKSCWQEHACSPCFCWDFLWGCSRTNTLVEGKYFLLQF